MERADNPTNFVDKWSGTTVMRLRPRALHARDLAAKARRLRERRRSRSIVDPSISVKRNVTVPEG
jgi:hypothetical protein